MNIQQELVINKNGDPIGTVIGPCQWMPQPWLALSSYRSKDGFLLNRETWHSCKGNAVYYINEYGGI